MTSLKQGNKSFSSTPVCPMKPKSVADTSRHWTNLTALNPSKTTQISSNCVSIPKPAVCYTSQGTMRLLKRQIKMFKIILR